MVQEIYRENPELYDRLHDEKDYEGEAAFVAEAYSGSLSEATVLDIGCGTGQHHPYLAERGCDLLGVDANESVLELASEKCDQFDYRTARLPSLDHPEIEAAAPFDLVLLLYDVINYLPPDQPRPTFGRIETLLATDGTVIFDNATLPDDGWEPSITTTRTDDGEYIRLGKLEPTGDDRFQWEAAVMVQHPDRGFDFFTDEETYTQFETDQIVDHLTDLGFETTVHDGYDTGSRTDEFLTVFVADRG